MKGNENRRPGWIKLHRRLIEWEWYTDTPVKSLFLHLLLMANHSDNRYRGYDIPRGSLVTGRRSLSAQTGLSEQQVRTAIDKLELTKEVKTQPTHQFTIITICNYESYQGDFKESNQQVTNEQPTDNQRATNEQPTSNHYIRMIIMLRMKRMRERARTRGQLFQR